MKIPFAMKAGNPFASLAPPTFAVNVSEGRGISGQGCRVDSRHQLLKPPWVVSSSKGRLEQPFGLARFFFNQKVLLNSWIDGKKSQTNPPSSLVFIWVSFTLVTCSVFSRLKLELLCSSHAKDTGFYSLTLAQQAKNKIFRVVLCMYYSKA